MSSMMWPAVCLKYDVATLILFPVGEGGLLKGESSPVDERLAHVQRLLEELEPRQPSHHGNQDSSDVKRLSDEVEIKSQMFYSVIVSSTVTGQQAKMENIRLLNETWAGDIKPADIAFFIEGGEMDDNQSELQNVRDNIHQLPSSNLATELQVLRYLCQHKLNSSKWFFIANSDLYVKTRSLEEYLTELEALHYHYGYLGKPIKRDPIGRVCMPGPGSVLSRQTMLEVCSKLEDCKKLEYRTNCVLGECIRRHVPRLQCNKEGHPHELFVRCYNDAKAGPITEPRYRFIIDRALTIYPVTDPKLMLTIHQLTVADRLNQSQHLLQEIKNSLDQMDDLLPQTNVHAQHNKLETTISRDNVMAWKLINSNLLMSEEESSPALKISAVWKRETDVLMEKAMEYLTSWDDEASYSLKRIVNGYYRVDSHTGIEYIIDFEGKQSPTAETKDDFSLPAKHFRVILSRKFDSLEVDPVRVREIGVEQKHITIAVFMTVEHNGKFQSFMESLKKILIEDQRINVIVVKMSSNGERVLKNSNTTFVRSQISQYGRDFPQASFTVLESPSLLSRDHGIALAIRELRPNDIVFLADIDFEFDGGFLERCRSIPLQGQQVYFPISFSKADPSLLKSKAVSKKKTSISEHTGHWTVPSYHTATCLYAADILATSQAPGTKGMANSINVKEMYKTLIEKGYEIVKTVDRGLRRVYDGERPCSGMVGEGEGVTCSEHARQNYTELHSRMQLSVALFNHEEDDKF